MKILAIDTTSKICSVAILEDDKLIDERNLDSGLTHSENLMPLIKDILEKNELVMKNIELIGVDVGPGSFTGIRIGVATAKALAQVTNIPVASVTALETLAENSSRDSKKACLIDARNSQVYCGIYDENNNKLEEFADDVNIAIEKIKKYENIVLIGDGVEKNWDVIHDKIPDCSVSMINEQYARNVGLVSYKKYLAKDLKNADTVIPIYLRNKM